GSRDALREGLRPTHAAGNRCVEAMADAYVRMASLFAHEARAAARYHAEQDRELSHRIAIASPREAARLKAYRKRMVRAGVWQPTLPADHEAKAILRYEGP